MSELEFSRCFGGVARLYGEEGLSKLQSAHIRVIGIGGVGGWAAEALARHAVGKITLIDLDNIAESNFNRQLHAVSESIGKAKVTAMRERILSINPWARVDEIEDFITPENVTELLSRGFDGIVDCADDTKAKMAIAAYCRDHTVPLVMTGGAGGRLDPTKIKQCDLSLVTGDRLLAKVRNGLRRDYGFPKGNEQKIKLSARKALLFGIATIYSDEPMIQPDRSCITEHAVKSAPTGLNCAGYGSSVCVTASFGFAAVAALLSRLL